MRLLQIRTLALCAFLIASLAGCDSGGSDDLAVEGTYQLRSISGFDEYYGDQVFTAGQPTTATRDGFSLTIAVEGGVTLTASETFTLNFGITMVIQGLGSETETASATGTYTANGNSITLSGTSEGESFTQSATLNGDVLTMTEDGSTIVFER